jgi:hypothetical protein
MDTSPFVIPIIIVVLSFRMALSSISRNDARYANLCSRDLIKTTEKIRKTAKATERTAEIGIDLTVALPLGLDKTHSEDL